MKAWALVLTDDLDRKRGVTTPATESVTFTWGGVEYDLDLTKGHYDDLMAFMQTYIEAATPAAKEGQPLMGGHGQGGDMSEQTRRAYLAGMRRWADQRGRTNEYKAPGGGFYYKIPLRRDYEAWLAQQQAA
jgi:hypothetical protein